MRKRQTFALIVAGLFLITFQIVFNLYENNISTRSEFDKNLRFSSLQNPSIVHSNFNPNELNNEEWQKLGFSEAQTQTILKYKEVVGGKFISKEQLKKCYAISETKFKELEDFILLEDYAKENTFQKKSSSKKINISGKFNPDLLSQNDWVRMGFSEKQASAILKYKNYLGGSFVSKEKLKDCFMISDEQFRQMSPHLILPEKTPVHFSKTPQNNFQKFDPNTIDMSGWKLLGFSNKQAQAIINYRDKNLKGSFKTLEDIKKCYIISEEKFKDLQPYIFFNPSHFKNDSNNIINTHQQTDFANIDLNKITFKQLVEFGFTEKAAGSFIGFRNKLGGFANTNQMLDTYNIDKDLMQKLINTAKFNSENITKYSLMEAPEEWLKSHPYFKYSADKIIFHRASLKNDADILKALKSKPEYETKMRWYLK